jgi:hypothetical protein
MNSKQASLLCFSQLHQIFEERRGDDLHLRKACGQRAVDLLPAQGHQGACQLLGDGSVVLVVSCRAQRFP